MGVGLYEVAPESFPTAEGSRMMVALRVSNKSIQELQKKEIIFLENIIIQIIVGLKIFISDS